MSVFLDANVAMYLVGAAHPNRDRVVEILDGLVLGDNTLVTDAEVFQELLHRYAAVARPDALADAYRVMQELTDEVYPVTLADVDSAKALVLDGVGARDAIHVATMRAHRVRRIVSFDRDFDRFSDLERIH